MCKVFDVCNVEVDVMLDFSEDVEDDGLFGELYLYLVDILSVYIDLEVGDWRLDFIVMEVVVYVVLKFGL